jgi:hypothetical protein
MKKSLLLAILGLAAGVTSASAQGYIWLENYWAGPWVSYGPTGGTPGAGINSNFTAGIYFGLGGFAALVAADTTPYGNDIPTMLHPSLLLGTGTGSTATAGVLGFPGVFKADDLFQASTAAGATITAMVVAYNGSTYASSSVRGHSPAFQMVTQAASYLPSVGAYFWPFQVNAIPEPSRVALTGLGLVAFLVTRRRK